MKRRNFVLFAGLGVTAISVPIWYFQSSSEYNPLLTEPELLSHIWDGDTIKEVGTLYLKEFSDENSERELLSMLRGGRSAEPPTTTAMLQQKISQDYKQGNIIMVDGWLLSRTEARQCALFSLTQNK